MWLITAGPTREYLDDVRFLSNASSGRMGYELAGAAARRGQRVLLVSGPVSLAAPPGVEVRDVVSAEEMLAAAREELLDEAATVLIGVAAVSDFRPKERRPGKPPKERGEQQLQLVENPDVIQALCGLGRSRLCVGFALERIGGDFEAAEQRARAKLTRKGLDAILLNDASAMESAQNHCYWIDKDAVPAVDLGAGSKSRLAEQIVDRILTQLGSPDAAPESTAPPLP